MLKTEFCVRTWPRCFLDGNQRHVPKRITPCHGKEWRPWWQPSFSLARTSKTGSLRPLLSQQLGYGSVWNLVSRHEESYPRKTGARRSPFLEAGLYTQDQESFLGSCVLQKLNPFTFFFIQLSWLFPLLWSCVHSPTILLSPQPPHAKLWRECLSIGLLTRILLSFRSKTCLIFLSILLVQSLWSPLDHVRFILSHDRSQLEDRSSERELFSLISGLLLRWPF